MDPKQKKQFKAWLENDSGVLFSILCDPSEPMFGAFDQDDKVRILWALTDEQRALLAARDPAVAEEVLEEAEPHRLHAAATMVRWNIQLTLRHALSSKLLQLVRAIAVHRPPHPTEEGATLNQIREECQTAIRDESWKTWEGPDPASEERRVRRF